MLSGGGWSDEQGSCASVLEFSPLLHHPPTWSDTTMWANTTHTIYNATWIYSEKRTRWPPSPLAKNKQGITNAYIGTRNSAVIFVGHKSNDNNSAVDLPYLGWICSLWKAASYGLWAKKNTIQSTKEKKSKTLVRKLNWHLCFRLAVGWKDGQVLIPPLNASICAIMTEKYGLKWQFM